MFIGGPLVAAEEQGQRVGLFDPALQGDPMLVSPHNLVRTVVSLLFVFSGLAHVGAAALYRRSAKRLLTMLIVLGAVSLVPTSIAFAVLTLFVINRPEHSHIGPGRESADS